MSNISEKNTDRNLSDYLPCALVKDWRQFLRSRGYIAMFVLLQLVGWFLYIQALCERQLDMHDIKALRLELFYFGLMALTVIVPFRAGSSVSSDTRVRGTNFLMLTPLTARRIVWGTWCSAAIQVLLAGLLAVPLVIACRHLQAGVEGTALDIAGLTRDLAVLGLFTLCGWVTASLFMFTAGLARFFRIALCLGVAVSMASVFSLVEFAMEVTEQEETLDMLTDDPLVLPLLLIDGIAVFMLMLELTRRHYAAPAENCSASVRLLALLPLLAYLGLAVYEYHISSADRPVTGLVEQGIFASFYILFALLADALLPTYAMPVHSRRAWRFLPTSLQIPGLVPSTACILLGVVLAALPSFISGDSAALSSLWSMDDRLEYLAVHGLSFINLAYTLLLWLLITDMLCRRDNRNRPVIYGFTALVTLAIAQLLSKSFVGDMLLPLAGQSAELRFALYDWRAEGLEALPKLVEAYVAGSLALVTVVTLLISWRGGVRKG